MPVDRVWARHPPGRTPHKGSPRGLMVQGGVRRCGQGNEHRSDLVRGSPDPGARGGIAGAGEPTAHPGTDHPAPAGFTAGALTSDVNPQRLLGPAFQPLVSLAVALILYDSGLGLDRSKLRGHTRRVVHRLVLWAVPITLAFGAVFAAPLLGMSSGAALMTGTILVVSGPTVVNPLLSFVRPTERLQRILGWEGSLIDPVGGILGGVVFHAVLAGDARSLGRTVGQFGLGIFVGGAGGGGGGGGVVGGAFQRFVAARGLRPRSLLAPAHARAR